MTVHKKLSPLFLALFLLVACNPDAPADQTAEVPAPAKVEPAPVDTVPQLAVETPPVEEVAEEKEEVTAKEVKAEPEQKEKPKPKPKPKKRPKATFAATTYNYGRIMQGDEVEHNFTFTNNGKADLLITNVSASCGCTHPSYPFIPIAPGEEGTIGVFFDSKGRLGRQSSTITVVTNARPTTYKLKLEGYVDAERAVEQPAAPRTPETQEPESEEEG